MDNKELEERVRKAEWLASLLCGIERLKQQYTQPDQEIKKLVTMFLPTEGLLGGTGHARDRGRSA